MKTVELQKAWEQSINLSTAERLTLVLKLAETLKISPEAMHGGEISIGIDSDSEPELVGSHRPRWILQGSSYSLDIHLRFNRYSIAEQGFDGY